MNERKRYQAPDRRDRVLVRQLRFRSIIGPAYCLRLLLDLRKANAFYGAEIGSAKPLDSSTGLLEGYKFAALVAVYNLLEAVADSPDLLGIRRRPGLTDHLHWRRGIYPVPTGTSAHEELVRNVWWVRSRLIRANTWDELRIATREVREFVGSLWGTLAGHYVVRRGSPRATIPLARIVRDVAVDYLHVEFHDKRTAEFVYPEMYRGGSALGRPTRLRDLLPDEEGDSPREAQLLGGYEFAVGYMWWRILGQKTYRMNRSQMEAIRSAQNWEEFDGLFGSIGGLTSRVLGARSITQQLVKGQDYRLAKPLRHREVSHLVRRRLEHIPESDPLESIFEGRPLRVGGSDSLTTTAYFRILFNGLLMQASRTNDKVRFIRLRHPEGRGAFYSYALFIPAYGSLISNASEYWIMIGQATDFSGGGNDVRTLVDSMVQQAGNRVEVRDFEVPNLSSLKKYAESRQIKFLRSQVEDFGALLSAFRGSLSELVVSELLQREGWRVVDVRRSVKSLEGKQVDVIAFRSDPTPRIVLVECKAYLQAPWMNFETLNSDRESDTDGDLKDAIAFAKTVHQSSTRSDSIYRELGLGIPGTLSAVIAVFGVAEPGAVQLLGNFAEIWDWENLRERLLREKIHPSIWQPLERFAIGDELVRRVLRMDRDLFSDGDVWRSR